MYQEDPIAKPTVSPPPHYYGDIVRTLMIIGGVVMMGTLPFFADLVPGPLFFSVFAMLVLAVFGGLMNPRQRWIVLFDAIISGAAFLIFEYYAIAAFQMRGFSDTFFIVNQILALVFFVSVYFGTKTVRAMYLGT